MLVTPLQLGEALSPNRFEAAMLVVQLLKVIAGFAIAYIAYRGYRRNESRPMLFLSIGFVLVLLVPFVLYVGGLALVALVGLPSIGEAVVVVASEVSSVIGLLVIVYALRM